MGKKDKDEDTRIECSDCGEMMLEDDSHPTNDGSVCDSCYDNYSTCEHCFEAFSLDDMKSAENRRGEVLLYCESCFEDRCFTCHDCDNAYLEKYSISYNGGLICESCYGDHYFTCEGCSEVCHNDDMACSEDGCYCEMCAPDQSSGSIHNYHHKPRSIFHRVKGEEKLYIGIELEVEGNRDHAEDVLEYSNDENLFWIEDDSSIDNGFEIVSHPATLEFHMDGFPWKTLTEDLREKGFKSHNTSTCGLHIHVGKKTLTESNQIKMGLFVGFNSDNLKILGRRDYNSFCHKKELEKGNLKSAKYSPSRYEAINFTNEYTIEFRFFRGTLKYETIIASIQFVHALVKFCKGNGFPSFVRPCWQEFCFFVTDKKEYKRLADYMKLKGIMGPFELNNIEREEN